METEELKEYWTTEFEPRNLDEMVLTSELRTQFKNLLSSKSKFNCLLAGSAGIGKTTIAKMLARELNASVLFIPCGIEGTVSVAQGKIKNFCESLEMEGKPKLVLLDELDSASGTQDSSMQKTLRNIISESPDTMFIATCNYPEKIIEPIRSRLGVINLKFTGKDLWVRLKFILDTKKITYTNDSLSLFIKNVLKIHYPDIRRIISEMQTYCSTGTLIVPESISTSDKSFMSELIDKVKTEKDILALRQFYITNKSKIEDYLTFSSELFNYLLDNGILKDKDVIVKMSNMIYQMNLVIDKEITFFGMMTMLNKSLSL